MHQKFAKSVFTILGLSIVLSLSSLALLAQNYSTDPRNIALGGLANVGAGNSVFDLVPEKTEYRTIPIPLGLIQVFSNLDVFDVNDPNFDLSRLIDYVGNPLHLTASRDNGEEGLLGFDFLGDLRDATLALDLNTYRGFTPPEQGDFEGLIAPDWGHTFTVPTPGIESSHGIFVGVGPYFAFGTAFNVDPGLVAIWESDVDVTVPANTIFPFTDISTGQLAMSITGGYRGRFPLPGQATLSGSDRNGLYFSADYHFLNGFRYDQVDFTLNLETEATGLITPFPTVSPLIIDQLTSTNGSGFALDFGVAAIQDKWELGFGANGVGNRINWTDFKLRRFELADILLGADFVESTLVPPAGTTKVSLPVRYAGNVAYHEEKWSVLGDLQQGFEGFTFHVGSEYRLSRFEFRAGGRYTRDRLEPAGGIGLNLTRRLSLDVAMFSSSANIERAREFSTALGLRINPSREN